MPKYYCHRCDDVTHFNTNEDGGDEYCEDCDSIPGAQKDTIDDNLDALLRVADQQLPDPVDLQCLYVDLKEGVAHLKFLLRRSW